MKPLPLLVLAVFTAATLCAQTRDQQPTWPMLGVECGRFVLGQIGPSRKDQFLLDTQTGRVWRFVETKDISLMLDPVPVAQTNGAITYAPDLEIGPAKQQHTAEENEKAPKQFEVEGETGTATKAYEKAAEPPPAGTK